MMARWGRQRLPEDRVHVRLWLRLDNGDACAFKGLVELAALVHDPSRLTLLDALAGATPVAAAARPSDVFQLYGFEVSAGETALTDFTSMCAVTRCGLRLLRLVIGQFSPLADDLLTLPTLVACLRSLFVSNTGATALSIDKSSTDLEPAVFQAICSAVAATSSLCDVRFTASVSGVYWPWLAYALLRSDVRPRCITSVGVNVECLTLQDLPKIERVLCARDPLAALAMTAAPDDRSREVVDVGPHTTGLVPAGTATDGDPTFAVIGIDETGCLDLDVVETVGAHVGVLYPGAGVCYVRRDEIVPQRRASSLPSSPPPALRSLELHLYDGTSLDALILLLQLVGPFTQRLVLFGGHCIELSASFMLGLLAACPQLERLNLSNLKLESFGWLTRNETVRLASLEPRSVYSSDPQALVPIATELRDTTRRLSSTLRELLIVEGFDWESIAEFLDMLKTNYMLETLLFGMYSEYGEWFEQPFRSHDDEPLHIPDGPFPTRNRLALLTVLKHRSDLTVLAPDILDIVIKLAAPNKHRVCGFVHRNMPPP